MALTPVQQDKLTAAIAPLYADVDFAGVSDILAEVTITPPPVATETDGFDVAKPAPAPTDLPAVQ